MHGYAESGLEVVPSNYPEARYDQQHYAPESVHQYQYSPPEVVPSSGPIPAHDPQEFPPELVHDAQTDYSSSKKELVTVRENLVQGSQTSELEKSDPTITPNASRRRWRWYVLAAAVVVVLAGVGAGVGLTVGRKSSSTTASGSAPGPASSASPTSPSSGSPPGSGSAPSGIPYISPTSSSKESILHNSSLAAISCDTGDRWVFLQDKDGLVRGAQFSASNSQWSISSNAYSYQTAAMGTTVAASCSNATAFQLGGAATMINVVYMNDSSALQQTLYDGSTWADAPVLPALQNPNNNTKISISSGVFPSYSYSPNSSFFEGSNPSWFSAAIYESGSSLVQVSLSGVSDSSQLNQSNSFAHFDGVGEQQSADEGFSCIHNGLLVPDGSEFFQQCFFGHSTQSPPDGTFWQYNRTNLNNNDTISPTTTQSSSIQTTQQGSTGADLSVFLLPNKQLALVSLLSNNSIALYTGKVASALSKGPFIWPFAIPTAHISATSLTSNSTTIYVYYQANASSLAEISFDTVNETWASQPAYITIP